MKRQRDEDETTSAMQDPNGADLKRRNSWLQLMDEDEQNRLTQVVSAHKKENEDVLPLLKAVNGKRMGLNQSDKIIVQFPSLLSATHCGDYNAVKAILLSCDNKAESVRLMNEVGGLEQWIPLVCAVRLGHLKIAELLISMGSPVPAQKVLTQSHAGGDAQVLSWALSLKPCNINLYPDVLKKVVMSSYPQMMNTVLRSVDNQLSDANKSRCLVWAVQSGSVKRVRNLLSQGADPLAKNKMEGDQNAISLAIKNNEALMVVKLIQKVASKDIDAELFGYAVVNSCPQIVSALLQHGLDPNYSLNNSGKDSDKLLWIAVRRRKCDIETLQVVEHLLRKGASPFLVHTDGYRLVDLQSVMRDVQTSSVGEGTAFGDEKAEFVDRSLYRLLRNPWNSWKPSMFGSLNKKYKDQIRTILMSFSRIHKNGSISQRVSPDLAVVIVRTFLREQAKLEDVSLRKICRDKLQAEGLSFKPMLRDLPILRETSQDLPDVIGVLTVKERNFVNDKLVKHPQQWTIDIPNPARKSCICIGRNGESDINLSKIEAQDKVSWDHMELRYNQQVGRWEIIVKGLNGVYSGTSWYPRDDYWVPLLALGNKWEVEYVDFTLVSAV